MVDGKLVFRDGVASCVDQVAVLDQLREAHAALTPELDRIGQLVDQLRPAYERIYCRANAHSIPADTFEAKILD